MRRCIGQTVHLGRRYLLAETVQITTFHPKLIARLSREGGRVWLGSGNLTYTGWGGNRELGTSWPIGPGEVDPGAWLDELLGAVSGMVRSTSFADQLRAIRAEAPWLALRSDAPAAAPVLFGMPGRPLAPQLAQRWAGKAVRRRSGFAPAPPIPTARFSPGRSAPLASPGRPSA